MHEERIAAVREGLRNLKKECREIIHLHYAKGMKYKEIAQELGIRTGTVGSRLSRCLEQLGENLPNDVISME